MNTPDYDPDTHCIRCERRYRGTDENCPRCGFDPVNSEEDDNENETAKHPWRIKIGV